MSQSMPIDLVAGLDDIATENQLTSGWSFIVLPKTEAAQFAPQAQRLLPSGVPKFHAREFNSKDVSQCQAYKDFLSLLRETAEASPACLLACSLNDQTWHNDLTSFAARIVPNVFAALGVTDKNVLAGAVDAAPLLFTLSRLLEPSSAALSSLEIDQNTVTGRFASRAVSVNGSSMPATQLLALLADAYRKQLFPQSPSIRRSSVSIVNSRTSFLVQAADVLGNFSMNYLIRNLAPTTSGRTQKAQIFETVFQDLLPETRFGQLASLSGSQLELALKNPCALTFKIE
jgi:hypothetical protein